MPTSRSTFGQYPFGLSLLEGTAIEVLGVGQAVTYEAGRGRKGPWAEKVGPP